MLKPPSTTQNLIKARELIADERNWSRSGSEWDQGKLCSTQALGRVTGRDEFYSAVELLDRAAREHGYSGILTCNSNGHVHALKMFDRAISLSLEQEG